MRFSLLIKPLIGISIFLGLGYIMLAPSFHYARSNFQRAGCQSNLKQIALACANYLADNEDRFPALSRGELGWADVLKIDTKTYAIFHCPTTRQNAETRSSDYFLNARLANLKSSQIKLPAQTVSFGEGTANGATNSHLLEMPLQTGENSPTRRHLDGANYAFADGHVKWLKVSRVTNKKPDDGDYTFAVR